MKNTTPLLWMTAVIGIFVLGYLWYQGQAQLSVGNPEMVTIADEPVSPTPPTTQTPAVNPPITQKAPIQNTMSEYTSYAKITTNKGVITVGFYGKDAPKTVENFTTLANKKFYDGIIFHRVIKGFMIQGGDPTGTGMGGPGYKFADEINPTSALYKRGYKRGVVAMANSGANTNGSQFFIMHADYQLPPSYTIFGNVVAGQEVVDAIATSPTGAQDRPTDTISMTSVVVVDKP
jgi:cyclophilin family peptidyl-prolyl cis-trans isomerase